MYKSMLFRSFDQRLNLLECTKYNHTWGITASPSAARLFIFFFQHLGTEVKVFVKIEIKIRVKGCFSSKFAFSIFIISTLVPHWIAAIEVIAYIVRYICNNQLCWLNSIFFYNSASNLCIIHTLVFFSFFFSEARYTLAPAGGWLLSIFRLFFITYCKYLRISTLFGFDIALFNRQLV